MNLAVAFAVLLALPDAAPPQGPARTPAGLDAWGDPLPPGALFRTGTLRARHDVTGPICYSPDGKTLAAAGHDGTIRLVNPESRRDILSLAGYEGGVCCLEFSPDGKFLVSGGQDKAVRVWDVATGKLTACLTGHTDHVWDIAVAPCGTWLASCDVRDIRFWDLKTGKQTRRIASDTWGTLYRMSLSPDGKFVAAESHDRPLLLWETATSKPLKTFEGTDSRYEYPHFLPDGKTLLTTGHSYGVNLWDIATGKRIRKVEKAASPVAVSPDGKIFASGESWCEGTIHIWELATGKHVRSLRGHFDGLFALAFSPDGKTLASLGGDRNLRRWDVASGDELDRPVAGHAAAVSAIAFSPDGKILASGGVDRTVRLWNPLDGKEVRRLAAEREVVCGLVFVGKDTLLSQNDLVPPGVPYASSQDDALTRFRLWDVGTGRERRRFDFQKTFVSPMAYCPASHSLASLGPFRSDTPIRLLNTVNGKSRSWNTDVHGTKAMALSPDGSLLAVVGDYVSIRQYGEVSLWDVSTGKQLWEHTIRFGSFNSVAFSPDGKILAAGGRDEVKLWNPATGKELMKLERGRRGLPLDGEAEVFDRRQARREAVARSFLAFSPDGKTLATCGPGTSVILWEMATGRERRRFAGHEVSCLAFSPDGRLLATGGADTQVMGWDVTGRMEGGRLRAGPADDKAVDALWANLGSQNATTAFDAVWAVAALPPEAVGLLRRRLRVNSDAELERAAHLLDELDDDDFDVRQRATQGLARMGRAAEVPLRHRLAGGPSHEVRARADRLLRDLGPATEADAEPTLRRGLRLIEGLELNGTPQAEAALSSVAERGWGTRLQEEAKASLLRLRGRDTPAIPADPDLGSEPERPTPAEVIPRNPVGKPPTRPTPPEAGPALFVAVSSPCAGVLVVLLGLAVYARLRGRPARRMKPT